MMDLLRLLPAADALDAGPWAALRRAPRHADKALTGTARAWLRKLPAGRRPLRLCCSFPRVANRIAWCWPDLALSEQVLEDLLVDRRGGRRGFPRPIVLELRRLRDFNQRERQEPPELGLWGRIKRALSTI